VGYFSSLPARLIEKMADKQSRNKVFLDQLTEAKREIALLIAQGKTDAEIAKITFRSPSTVKKHIREILRQFNLKNRTQIAVLISQNQALDSILTDQIPDKE
jgi:DNA-binding NarL/FixJ family response regulator